MTRKLLWRTLRMPEMESLKKLLSDLKAERDPLEQRVIQLTSAILEVEEKLFALYQQRKS
jgi:hypothetical protein